MVYVPSHADVLLREHDDHGGCDDEVCGELARISGIECPLRRVLVMGSIMEDEYMRTARAFLDPHVTIVTLRAVGVHCY